MVANPGGNTNLAWWPGPDLTAGTAAVMPPASHPAAAGTAAVTGPGRPAGGCPLGRPGCSVVGCFTVPAQPRSVGTARGFVARLLADEPDAGTTVLLASELVANSVLHSDSGRTGAPISLAVLALTDGIRIEVADQGAATVPLVREPTEFTPGGRGLRLVDALSSRWGFFRTEATTITWFETGR